MKVAIQFYQTLSSPVTISVWNENNFVDDLDGFYINKAIVHGHMTVSNANRALDISTVSLSRVDGAFIGKWTCGVDEICSNDEVNKTNAQ